MIILKGVKDICESEYKILVEANFEANGKRGKFSIYLMPYNTEKNRPWSDAGGHHEGRVKLEFSNGGSVSIIYTKNGRICKPEVRDNSTKGHMSMKPYINFVDNNIENIIEYCLKSALPKKYKGNIKPNLNMKPSVYKDRVKKRPNDLLHEYIEDKYGETKPYYKNNSVLDEIMNMF